MQALKVVVVIMGLMLLAGLTLLGAVVASRMAQRPPAPAALPGAPETFGVAPIRLPAGARIQAIQPVAERLVVDIVLADGNRQLIVVDPISGRQLGIISFSVGP